MFVQRYQLRNPVDYSFSLYIEFLVKHTTREATNARLLKKVPDWNNHHVN